MHMYFTANLQPHWRRLCKLCGGRTPDARVHRCPVLFHSCCLSIACTAPVVQCSGFVTPCVHGVGAVVRARAATGRPTTSDHLHHVIHNHEFTCVLDSMRQTLLKRLCDLSDDWNVDSTGGATSAPPHSPGGTSVHLPSQSFPSCSLCWAKVWSCICGRGSTVPHAWRHTLHFALSEAGWPSLKHCLVFESWVVWECVADHANLTPDGHRSQRPYKKGWRGAGRR